MDYPCGKFGNCSFSRLRFITRTDRETDRQNHKHTDAAKRLTRVTVVGVSRYAIKETLKVRIIIH